ncbi:MAG: plasma-membrane proton-efflux P-type ATPase [Methanomassiliicoccales archaeon]
MSAAASSDMRFYADGLSTAEALRRLETYGYNEVAEYRHSFALQIAKKFWGITPWMLEITIALTWFLHRYTDAYIVASLLLFNAGLSLFEERHADAAVSALKQKLSIKARVKRDGSWKEIEARELVPGDLLRIRSGDFVPADCVIEEGELETDQSALTGESLSVSKKKGEQVYSGSIVRRGEATCSVAATGAKTYFGRTVELVQFAKPKLHFEEVTAKVVRWLLLMVVSLLSLSIIVSALRGANLESLIPLIVILLVSAIPVALPSMFNISMALGSLELSTKGVLVTRLSASEDAASMDVLCTDKTGTLTKNKLVVTEVIPFNGSSIQEIAIQGALASSEADRDPIDMAFLEYARQFKGNINAVSILKFMPFDPSTRKTSALISDGSATYTVCKGAVDTILDLCHSAEEERTAVREQVGVLTSKGYRVLAVAKGEEGGAFSLSGLVALSDELREDAGKLINELEGMGISVKMLTGDALPVAREVARALNLEGAVEDMSSLRGNKEGLSEAVQRCSGLAGVYPEDKYSIVSSLQSQLHVVGMTGDGVNDAAALKQAEVGIAVKDATDVAKSAASAVLMREGLEPVADMVKIGRMIYQRVVTWVINKFVKTFQIVAFVVIAFLLTGIFPVSIFSMVLYLFLTDFVTLSLSTDRVRYSKKPETWKISTFVTLGVSLGLFVVLETLLFLFSGMYLFGLKHDISKLHTYVFAYLVFSGVLNVLIVRERDRFWKSAPSRPLLLSVLLDIILVTAIALTGFYSLAPLPITPVLFSLGWSAAMTFLVNDQIKLILSQRERYTRKEVTVV